MRFLAGRVGYAGEFSPLSQGSGYPPSEASAAGGSMRGVATPVFLLLLLFFMLKTNL